MKSTTPTVILFVVISAVCGGSRVEASQEQADLAPLPLELPEPFFGGTPWDGPLPPRFDDDLYKTRPPFMAPKGTRNVAFKKGVTSSAPTMLGGLEQITDGDKCFHEHTSQVQLPPGVQWVQVDLQEEFNIYAILLWHFHVGRNIYWDVTVRISNTSDFTGNVVTVYSNDIDNSSGFGLGQDNRYFESHEGRLIDAKGVSGRYVRFYSNGNFWDDFNSYAEVEVYGLPMVTKDVPEQDAPKQTKARHHERIR